ncbi:unnamed protein product [Euphydryas editha]|uniref:DNA helicase Pif1-like 2B domain-containing protein n=1 Tax=Euphydryas editha TaxID=104508 RepID=A0AAU9U7A0_EUPED|nr:unnamed protein product [Euphydryas editha]
MVNRAYHAPKNEQTSFIKEILLRSFEGVEYQYKSVNSVMNTDDASHYPAEFLNTLKPLGFPTHILRFRFGAPIMLLRNINPPELCNGTRFQVKTLHRNVIEVLFPRLVVCGMLQSSLVILAPEGKTNNIVYKEIQRQV